MMLKRLACGLALLCLPLAAEAQSLAPQTTWVNDHAQFVIQSVDAEGRLAGSYTNYGPGFGCAGRAFPVTAYLAYALGKLGLRGISWHHRERLSE